MATSPGRRRIVLRPLWAGLAVSGLFAGGPLALAQPFPSRAVRIVVPYTPGGGIDVLARVLGQKLSELWGQPVVIDNKPGAGSHLGTDSVAKAPPDGATWVIVSNTMALAAAAGTRLPYDPLKDLAPAVLATSAPFLLAATPKLGVTTLKQFLDAARTKPGGLNFASAGQGTSTHLAIELLRARTQIPVLHVPYRGSGPALTDLIDGRVDALFATPAALMPHVREKRLVAIGVTGRQRTDSAAGVPTLIEGGIADLEMVVWFGLLGPAGTPAPILHKLHQDTLKVLAMPDVVTRLRDLGQDVTPLGPQEFGAQLREEVRIWGDIIRRAGLSFN